MNRRRCLIGFGAGLAGSAFVAARGGRAADAALAATIARIEAESGGRLGVAILDTATGFRFGHRAGERFPLCSTAKLLACGALLARADAGHEELGRRIRFEKSDLVTYSPATTPHAGADGMTLADLCAVAISRGDNTAGNLALARIGGPEGLTRYLRSIGDGVTRLDRTEPTLNEATPGDPRDTTTPDAMLADVQTLVLGDALMPASRETLTGWLVANTTGDARLRAGVPKGWRIADKTGTGGYGTTNDVAVIWPPGRAPLIVCAYLTETRAAMPQCEATIAAVGRAAASLV